MSAKRLAVFLVFVLLLGLGIAAGPPISSSSSPAIGKPFSIVPLHPDAAKAFKARGKALPNPFPNSANRGRKFNPTGDLVGALTTAHEQKVLVLFIDSTTAPPGGPATRLDLGTYFDTMLFGTVYDPPEYHPLKSFGLDYPTDRTLKNYYKEVSYGAIDVITLNLPSALGWVQSGKPYDYYCKADGIHDYGFGPHPTDASGLVLAAVKAADDMVDFSQYAVDGVVPNLFVVHAGTGAEWNGDPSLIWSHSWSLGAAMGNGTGYKTHDGVWVSNYAMMPEVGGDLTDYLGYGAPDPAYPPTVGVYAHEYGHVLGLPDQYDYGYESQGTGNFSLMAGGSWNTYPYYNIFSGNSPAHLDAWSKYRLGLVDPVVVSSDTDVSIPAAETAAVVYKMMVPNSDGKEYFLFENRQWTGFDQGLVYFTYGADGTPRLYAVHGLAIYHVDDGVLTRNYWRPNEAENWKEFRSEGWRKAWTGESHYGVSLIQADDRWHLERNGNYGDPGDLYPGAFGVTSFGNDTSPNSSAYYFWAGGAPKFGFSGVTATNIQESKGVITAKLSFVPVR